MTHTGNLIKIARVNRNLSQQDLQALIGLKIKNGQTISNVERGIVALPKKHINILCSILKISKDSLIDCMLRDYKEDLLNDIKPKEIINEPVKAINEHSGYVYTQIFNQTILQRQLSAGEVIDIS